MMTVATQASSATVLATIGFITSGMMSIAAAIPLVAGATVGTSSTTWLVATLGLSTGIAAVLMPLLALGAVLRTLGRGRWRHIGTAIAGITVLLLAITFIKDNVAPVASSIDLAGHDGGTITGRLALVAIGMLLGCAMQSSAAPIALVMVALHSGTLGWNEAASVTIGATIGTTSTGVLATLGTRASARRIATAWAICALVQATIALLLFTPLRTAAHAIGTILTSGTGAEPNAISLAAFHTGFSAIGALPLLIGAVPLARLLARWIPDRSDVPPVVEFDRSALEVPGVAAATARRGLTESGVAVTSMALVLLRGNGLKSMDDRIASATASLDATRRFIGEIQVPDGDSDTVELQRGTVGALDHLTRLLGDVRNLLPASRNIDAFPPVVRTYLSDAQTAIEVFDNWLRNQDAPPPLAELKRISASLGARRKQERSETLNRTAAGETTPDTAIAELDALRYADRMVHHAAKAASYLAVRVNGAAHVAPADNASSDIADEPS
jgi:phosphate:Na+ symporter